MTINRDWTPHARLMDALSHPLWHIVCPRKDCGIRFGLEPDDFRFLEQTGTNVCCPRGHGLILRLRATQ